MARASARFLHSLGSKHAAARLFIDPRSDRLDPTTSKVSRTPRSRARLDITSRHHRGCQRLGLGLWARKIEAEFARSLFPTNSNHELELDLSGFLRGDPETRWNAHKIALETGVLDPDEVREVEGWNPRRETPTA